MSDDRPAPTRGYGILGIVAGVVLWGFVLTRTRPAFFDEVPYLDLAAKLHAAPSLHSWLVHDYRWPAGPLHPLMHFLLSGGGSGWPAPWLRLPNLALFTALAALVGRAAWPRTPGGWMAGITLGLAVPMTWTISGMALTEIPAMSGLVAALLAALHLRQIAPLAPQRRWAWHGLVGLGLAIALCGRQTYLLMVPLVIWLALEREPRPVRALTATFVGLLPAILLFLTWRGLRSPTLTEITGGAVPRYAVLGLGYLGALVLWLAPRLWFRHWPWAVGAGMAAAAGNAAAGWVHVTTMTSAQHYLPAGVSAVRLEQLATVAAMAAGGGFVVIALREAALRRDRLTIACTFGLLLIAAACAGVTHQFSSRYVATGLPLLMLWLAPEIDTGIWGCFRTALAMLAGFASLLSYYQFAG